MAIENFYPIAGATHDLPAGSDAWTNSGGANKNASTTVGGGRPGPPTHDDDTTFIFAASGVTQSLNVSWPGPMVTLNGVMHELMRHRQSAAAASTRDARFVNAAGTASATSPITITDSNTVYADTTSVDIGAGGVYRPGAGAWTLADFADDKTIFIQVVLSGALNQCRVTSLWGDISFVPPGGGFVFLLGLAGLLAAPIAGVMDATHFARFLSWRRRVHPRHTILTGDEVARAWRELREYRHPRFFFPAVA